MSPLPPDLTDRLLDTVEAPAETDSRDGVVELPEDASSAALPEGTEICLVAASGAGSLLALARRRLDRVRIRAVRIDLRDLNDLAGNAARVVAAARELPTEIVVRVGLPYAPGWVGAGEVVEAAGLQAAVQGTEVAQLAEQLAGLVELDLPFTIGRTALPVPALVLGVDALVDGAGPAEVVAVLGEDDHDRWRTAAEGWDEAVAVRIRRRLRSIVTDDLGAARRDLDLIS